jgi:hypothetical protein
MNTNFLKIIKWFIGIIILFYFSFWLLFQLNNSYPVKFTRYSNEFKMEDFELIKIGDSREDVEILIGMPLEETKFNPSSDSVLQIYWYSKNRFYLLAYESIAIKFYKNKVVDKVQQVIID